MNILKLITLAVFCSFISGCGFAIDLDFGSPNNNFKNSDTETKFKKPAAGSFTPVRDIPKENGFGDCQTESYYIDSFAKVGQTSQNYFSYLNLNGVYRSADLFKSIDVINFGERKVVSTQILGFDKTQKIETQQECLVSNLGAEVCTQIHEKSVLNQNEVEDLIPALCKLAGPIRDQKIKGQAGDYTWLSGETMAAEEYTFEATADLECLDSQSVSVNQIEVLKDIVVKEKIDKLFKKLPTFKFENSTFRIKKLLLINYPEPVALKCQQETVIFTNILATDKDGKIRMDFTNELIKVVQ